VTLQATLPAMVGGKAWEDEVVDLLPGLRIRVVGLATRPELNGQLGTLEVYDEGRRRWKVAMDDGSVKLFRMANLEPVGSAGAEQAAALAATADTAAATAPERPTSANSEAAAGASSRGQTKQSGRGGEEPAVRPKLRPGTQVAVRGLPGSGQGGFNGRTGVCEHFEFNTGRWHVRFEDKRTEAFKPDFLEVQTPVVRPGAYVRLQGLQGAAHLNGKVGICEKMDAQGGRWKVRLDTGELKALKPENLALLESYHAPMDDTPYPGQEQARSKVLANNDFCRQMEEMLESGEMQWMDY